MAATLADRYATSLRDSFLMAVHQWNFRGGAYKSLITKSTSVVQAFNTFITSEHMSADEKEFFKEGRKLFTALARIRQPDMKALLPMMEWGMEATDLIFAHDARSQGIYVPDLTFQEMNDDGTVKETVVIHDDGTTTTTPGGIPSVPPGAPEEFVEKQKKNTEQFMKKVKESNGRVFIANHFDPKCVPDGTEDTSTIGGKFLAWSSFGAQLTTLIESAAHEKQQEVKNETVEEPKKPATSTKNGVCSSCPTTRMPI
jgi:hypothetical protein